jgi:hypothetical protein
VTQKGRNLKPSRAFMAGGERGGWQWAHTSRRSGGSSGEQSGVCPLSQGR